MINMKLEQDSFAKRILIGFVAILSFCTFSYACDTWVAVGNSTKDGSVILGKNSDRPSVEPQPLKYFPRIKNVESKVKCTHITIPQAEETYAHIGSNIWWLFGYEIGMNEWGVAIGNEAVWSKEPYEETGLLGMDLIRLALERARTAYEAMGVITKLLAEHGQGGGCEYPGQWDANKTYHNSFIIADPNEAWVLESAGKYWVAKKVEDVWAISNVYSSSRSYQACYRNGLVQIGTGFQFRQKLRRLYDKKYIIFTESCKLKFAHAEGSKRPNYGRIHDEDMQEPS
jgi:hypothetical protein